MKDQTLIYLLSCVFFLSSGSLAASDDASFTSTDREAHSSEVPSCMRFLTMAGIVKTGPIVRFTSSIEGTAPGCTAMKVMVVLPPEHTMPTTKGCVQDPSGVPVCTLSGTVEGTDAYTIDADSEVGTFTTFGCIISGPTNINLADSCDCVEITVPSGALGSCTPISLFGIFDDGFESGDTSAWS